MTAARLKAAPADGHGLTSTLCDSLYAKRQRGEPTGDIVCISVIRPVGTFERDTARGAHRGVQFEVVRCEPVREGGGLFSPDELRGVVEEAYQARTSHGIRTLPMDFDGRPEQERRLELIEAIEAWATAEGLTGKELEDKWRDLLGTGENAAGTYGKGSAQHLLMFAHAVGAVTDQDAADEDDDQDDEGSGDNTAPVEEPQAAAS